MLSRILGGVGRSMMTAGTLILLFVAYQLWGTGIQEARSQNKLEDQFTELLAESDGQATSDPAVTTSSTVTPAAGDTAPVDVVPAEVKAKGIVPKIGDAIAKIEIPKIGITRTVVEGDTVDQLSRGPGHYPLSPLPGQKGNVSIAGHRTTYGQPFHNIDKLGPGDQILAETPQGKFVYEITEPPRIVSPDAVEVLEDKGDNRLTLVACHPKYSLAQRIIVHGILRGEAKPELEGQAEAREVVAEAYGENGLDAEAATIDSSLSGRPASNLPAILWGVACAGIWLLTWLFQVLLRRRNQAQLGTRGRPTRGARLLTWTPYAIGLPVFLVGLYFFFENFGRFLPANY